jgi:hypothetical protein
MQCNATQRRAGSGRVRKVVQLYFGMVCSGLKAEEKEFQGQFDKEKGINPDLESKLTCWCCLS